MLNSNCDSVLTLNKYKQTINALESWLFSFTIMLIKFIHNFGCNSSSFSFLCKIPLCTCKPAYSIAGRPCFWILAITVSLLWTFLYITFGEHMPPFHTYVEKSNCQVTGSNVFSCNRRVKTFPYCLRQYRLLLKYMTVMFNLRHPLHIFILAI